MLPLGIPIIILYIQFFPALVSSWFITDAQLKEKLEIQKQHSQEALKYFLDCKSIRIQEKQLESEEEGKEEAEKTGKSHQITTSINLKVLENMSYEQKKILSNFLFGIATDGTVLIQNLFSSKFGYLMDPKISNWILTNDIYQRLEFEEGINEI